MPRYNLHKLGFSCLLLIMIVLCSFPGVAQRKQQDTANWFYRHHIKKTFLGMITRDPVDESPALHVKSEDAYLPYQGKIIRRIIIRRIGFESTVLDTAEHFQSFISNLANKIHTNTREFVIRDNLFIKEGKPLNPYRVADNERILRTLGFVKDARIFVKPISKKSDSIDLVVITRDVFSISGAFEPSLPARLKMVAQDINFAGAGQRILVAGLYDINRNPNISYEGLYQKVNVKGSFVDATIGYTLINTGTSLGNENETALYFRLSRALYQPFARWAGGLEYSNNVSRNVYDRPDTLFARYHYVIRDLWAGYSFGQKQLPSDLKENRNRKFIALRGYQQDFSDLPLIKLTEPNRYVYRTRDGVLTQLTFFRQDFYKTQYVVGFGITEDIPYGYRLSFTGGWERELGITRPYLGTELYYNKIHAAGTIMTYSAKLGSFWQGGKGQDGLLALSVRRFSKVYPFHNLKIRHQIEGGYAWLINQTVKQGIDIRDLNGIIGFRPDSLVGTQRITLSEEMVVFTPTKFLGFRLAPLIRVDVALINRVSPLIRRENFFSGISLGFRARNENLIFNTIEARVFIFPKTVETVSPVSFSISTNFVIKYPTNLVNRPATVFDSPTR